MMKQSPSRCCSAHCLFIILTGLKRSCLVHAHDLDLRVVLGRSVLTAGPLAALYPLSPANWLLTGDVCNISHCSPRQGNAHVGYCSRALQDFYQLW